MDHQWRLNNLTQQGYTINKEKETDITYVTVHEISQTGETLFKENEIPFLKILLWLEKPNESNRKKRYVQVIAFLTGIIEKAVTGLGMGLLCMHHIKWNQEVVQLEGLIEKNKVGNLMKRKNKIKIEKRKNGTWNMF